MTAETIHTCSYECERPGCIRAQRDELRDRLEAALAAPPSAPVGVEGLLADLETIWHSVSDDKETNAAYQRLKSALAQQPAAPVLAKYQPCGCVICTCEDEQQCQGCGAKHCGNRADHPPYVAQQPAVGVGEEIMVNTPYDVFTLPLRPSGLDGKGPRFVVHVPGTEQPAAADGVKCPWDGGSPCVDPRPAGMVYPTKPAPRASGYLDSSGVEWNAWDAGQMEAYARAAYSDGWEAGYREALAQQPADAGEMAELVGLLDEVRSHFTRDDDLPDDLLPRIDAAIAAQHREPKS